MPNKPPLPAPRRKPIIGYYRPGLISPAWLESWYENLEDDDLSFKECQCVLDDICRMACGVEIGASDQCQRGAEHIHSHLYAAFLLGMRAALSFNSNVVIDDFKRLWKEHHSAQNTPNQ